MAETPRILAIRGGAIGDFILTLPALRLLRENFANCRIEILGYPHIASLAVRCGANHDRPYADAVHSIEYGPLAGFFARRGTLDSAMCEFFSGYQQVISWLFDPDGIFEENLRRAGVKNYLSAYTKVNDDQHAAAQLASGLERMAMFLEGPPEAVLRPTSETLAEADTWLAAAGLEHGFTAIHPGSGSARKNWPIDHWRALLERFDGRPVLLVGGEADSAQMSAFSGFARAHHLPLPLLSAILSRAGQYFGHDTGISHIAAAVGVRCTLLFGPTAPAVWAPIGSHVRIIEAPDGDLSALAPDSIVPHS